MRMPEVVQQPCANGEAVVVRFVGKEVSPTRFGENFPAHFADSVMKAADADEARFVVVDVRNFRYFPGDLLGKCILLFKKLQHQRRDLIVLCESDIAELFELVKVDRILSVVQTEAQLLKVVESAADLPHIVNGAVAAPKA